jgi:hypothetical protein
MRVYRPACLVLTGREAESTKDPMRAVRLSLGMPYGSSAVDFIYRSPAGCAKLTLVCSLLQLVLDHTI